MVKCYDCKSELSDEEKVTIKVQDKALKADGYKCKGCGQIYVETDELTRLFELLRLK